MAKFSLICLKFLTVIPRIFCKMFLHEFSSSSGHQDIEKLLCFLIFFSVDLFFIRFCKQNSELPLEPRTRICRNFYNIYNCFRSFNSAPLNSFFAEKRLFGTYGYTHTDLEWVVKMINCFLLHRQLKARTLLYKIYREICTTISWSEFL